MHKELHHKKPISNVENKVAIAIAAILASGQASAQNIDTTMLGSFGCAIYTFLTGPLAIWAFILVLVGTLLIGLIAKIDFAKIIVVIVVFAVIQAIGTYIMGIPSVAAKLGTATCLTAG